MRRIVASIIMLLCVGSVAYAQCPAVTATVTTTDETVIYNYRLTNTTTDNIKEFTVFMPTGGIDTITSYATSQAEWAVFTRKAHFDMVSWHWDNVSAIDPGNGAEFSFSTSAGVPTTYIYIGGSTVETNWCWWNGQTSGAGNTILPVPNPVPEPSSILALISGLSAVGGLTLRRRK